MEIVSPVVPLARLISRLEKHAVHLAEEAEKTPWYAFKRRWILMGAAAAYKREAEEATLLAAKCQPVWGELRANRE